MIALSGTYLRNTNDATCSSTDTVNWDMTNSTCSSTTLPEQPDWITYDEADDRKYVYVPIDPAVVDRAARAPASILCGTLAHVRPHRSRAGGIGTRNFRKVA